MPSISYPYQLMFRPFSIIFIPNPTLELHNKSKALHDLAYIQTMLMEYKYNAVKHLEGSVSSAIRAWPSGSGYKTGPGSSGYRVCVQEWVSPILVSPSVLLTSQILNLGVGKGIGLHLTNFWFIED